MNIVDELKKLFDFVLPSLVIDDRVTTFRFHSEISQKPSLNDIGIKSFLQLLPNQDVMKFSLTVEDQEPIAFISSSYKADFIRTFDDYFEHYEKEEKIKLGIEIQKNVQNNYLNIYSWVSFNNFIKSLSLLQFVNVLSEVAGSGNCLNFKFLENSLQSFGSKWLKFGYDFDECQFQSQLHLIEANCYFYDIKKYPFTPDHFSLIKKPSTENAISEKLEILTVAFSIISIFDHSRFDSEIIEYRLNGYKLVQGSVPLTKELLDKGGNYIELYNWIYSSEGNIADKLGVARNIISLYIDNDSIKTDNGLIHSIKSAHQTYLKNNVASYLSIRSNILDELSWISQKSSEVIQNYLSSYKQSSLTFVSFFISIFLFRTLSSGNFFKIFNAEVSIIAFAFLILSILFLVFSRYTVIKERDRLIRKYFNLKMRYTDLLIKEDIDKILNKDSEFEYEKSFINDRIKQYTWLWCFTILILFFAILSVSELVPCSFYY